MVVTRKDEKEKKKKRLQAAQLNFSSLYSSICARRIS